MAQSAVRRRTPMPTARRGLGAMRVVLGCAGLFVALACDGGAASRSPARSGAAANSAKPTAPQRKSDDGPMMKGDHAVIREEAVGPLQVGAWRRPVMSFVYAISARAGRDSEDIIVVHGIGKDTVALTFENDTLRRVFITHAGPQTAEGIGIGSPFADVTSRSDASTTTRGTAQVASMAHLCGVEFATDSVALSVDSVSHRRPEQPAIVRAISVGYCKH